MTSPGPADAHRGSEARDKASRGFWWAAILVGLLVLACEAVRWFDPDRRLFALFGVLCGEEADWLPFVPLFALLALIGLRLRESCFLVGFTRRSDGEDGDGDPGRGPARFSTGKAWVLTLVVAAVAYGFSGTIGSRFVDDDGRPMPPAYHDEYSYLFQAETFLAGRTWFPSFEPRPELFDQMHVLNAGRFASRYFPGVGAWLAPFVAIGDPWLGQRVAHVLCAVLMFWIGRDLRRNVCGLTSGLLFAVSPGLALFSTLLLAHHPTLLGLLLFVWAFLRMRRSLSWVWAFGAGLGLACAMLCRPMTAAGVGLPFGVWFGWWLVMGRGVSWPTPPASAGEASRFTHGGDGGPCPFAASLSFRQRLRLALVLVAPLVAGIGLMLWYSWTITGDPLVTPYQQYTDIYTPRHVYGFNNVERGEQRLGPKVIDNYDEWAENLTPSLAAKNVWRRLLSSLRLTLGIVPLVFSLMFLLLAWRMDGELWLMFAAIVSLHVVHVPYWFEGIMGWHYVLESAPFWLLLCGAATADLFGTATSDFRSGRNTPPRARSHKVASGSLNRGPVIAAPAIRLWWTAILGVAVAVGGLTVPLPSDPDEPWLLWRGRLPSRSAEVRFARGNYAIIRGQVDLRRDGRPAALLVIPDPADRSLNFVHNDPALQGEVLRVRVSQEASDSASLAEIAALFSERMPLVLDARQRLVVPLVLWRGVQDASAMPH